MPRVVGKIDFVRYLAEPIENLLWVPIDRRSRDDFSLPTKDMLGKRVALKCSNPKCGRETSGPQVDARKVINIGVAAHISGAALGGPRYDASLAPEDRSDMANGIWLCQNCAKLVDNDTERYTVAVLKAWKKAAEQAAHQALEHVNKPGIGRQEAYSKIERLMPALLEEMRKDIAGNPVVRELVELKKNLVFWYPDRPMFTYFYEDHDGLDGKLQILENLGFIRDIRHNTVPRFVIEEKPNGFTKPRLRPIVTYLVKLRTSGLLSRNNFRIARYPPAAA
jgi:hypothetical protein